MSSACGVSASSNFSTGTRRSRGARASRGRLERGRAPPCSSADGSRSPSRRPPCSAARSRWRAGHRATAGASPVPPPMPVRHTTPPDASAFIASSTSSGTPVASMTMSGSKPTSRMSPVWCVAPSARDELGLRAAVGPVEHVHVEPALHAEERGEEPDRAGTGDERGRRLPEPRAGRSIRRPPTPSRRPSSARGARRAPRAPARHAPRTRARCASARTCSRRPP